MSWWQILLALVLAPMALRLAYVLLLRVAIWCWWCGRGRDVLLVTSDSPVWRGYIGERIVPRLGQRAVVLNWSQRKIWPVSLASLAFSHFRPDREFNPLVVVFRPFRRTRLFQFWRPFRAFKHGRPGELAAMERELFAWLQQHPVAASWL